MSEILLCDSLIGFFFKELFFGAQSGSFLENFYLVVLERLSTVIGDEGSRVHMWQITISSQPNAPYYDGECFVCVYR